MEEIIGSFGDSVKAAIATLAVLGIMAVTLYAALQNGVSAYVSGLF